MLTGGRPLEAFKEVAADVLDRLEQREKLKIASPPFEGPFQELGGGPFYILTNRSIAETNKVYFRTSS